VAQLNVLFRLEAYADIDQAFYYYAEWSEGRVAARFMRTLDDALERISTFPKSCPVDQSGVRRLLLRRFPYWVYYRIRPDAVEVLAVQHVKRDSSQIDWSTQ
jgi:toxin ParE1/3/4